jgi:hypothetical protein
MNARRRLLAALAAAAAACVLAPARAAPPQQPFPYKAEVLEEGIFELAGAAPVSQRSRVTEHDRAKLVESTRVIPAVKGTTFGFRYRLSGLPGKHLPGFAMRAIHPAMKNPGGGKPRTTSTAPTFVEAEQGVAENEIVYTLNEAAEVKPGRWTLQLLYRGSVVLSREFTLK